MKGFLLGLLVAALAFGGYMYWKTTQGSGGDKVVARADAGAPGKKKRKRARGAARLARARGDNAGGPGRGAVDPGEPEPDPEPDPDPPIKLSAADKKIVGQGEDLSRPDVVRMDLGSESNLPELTQDDIDARFRAQEEPILDCITRSRPDPELYVPGTVTVKFRIQRAGTVRGVRVDAPAILQKGGIYNCIRGLVERLRFPASDGSQIVSYPFRLS